VKVTVNKMDDANVAVGGEIDNGVIERNIDRLAKEAVRMPSLKRLKHLWMQVLHRQR